MDKIINKKIDLTLAFNPNFSCEQMQFIADVAATMPKLINLIDESLIQHMSITRLRCIRDAYVFDCEKAIPLFEEHIMGVDVNDCDCTVPSVNFIYSDEQVSLMTEIIKNDNYDNINPYKSI